MHFVKFNVVYVLNMTFGLSLIRQSLASIHRPILRRLEILTFCFEF